MREYELLQDLPGTSAGAVFTWVTSANLYVCMIPEQNKQWTFRREDVEDRPLWFKLRGPKVTLQPDLKQAIEESLTALTKNISIKTEVGKK